MLFDNQAIPSHPHPLRKLRWCLLGMSTMVVLTGHEYHGVGSIDSVDSWLSHCLVGMEEFPLEGSSLTSPSAGKHLWAS